MQEPKLRLIQPSSSAEELDDLIPGESGMDELGDDSERVAALSSVASGGKSGTFKYGVIASVVLHFIVFLVLVRAAYMIPAKSILKPGETVTPVRIVEFPDAQKKDESPPKDPAAFSDRNRTAEKERLPKRPTGMPLPGMMYPRDRLAALKPPKAPEFFEKPEKQKAQEQPPKKREPQESASPAPDVKDKTAEKPPVTRDDLRDRKIDLMPNRQERELALLGRPGSPDYFEKGDPDEEVVDINTQEDKFGSYLLHLKHKIQGVWVYPKVAAEAGIGGRLTVEFLIAQDGKLLNVKLLDTSGHALLDQSALTAISTAAPYYPFPPRLKAKRLRVKANFIYVTERSYRRIM